MEVMIARIEQFQSKTKYSTQLFPTLTHLKNTQKLKINRHFETPAVMNSIKSSDSQQPLFPQTFSIYHSSENAHDLVLATSSNIPIPICHIYNQASQAPHITLFGPEDNSLAYANFFPIQKWICFLRRSWAEITYHKPNSPVPQMRSLVCGPNAAFF